MKYRLKPDQPEFMVVDGPMAGRRFAHGTAYDDVPEGVSSRFDAEQPAIHVRKTQKAARPHEDAFPVAVQQNTQQKGEDDA